MYNYKDFRSCLQFIISEFKLGVGFESDSEMTEHSIIKQFFTLVKYIS